jgi:hypothetical protein
MEDGFSLYSSRAIEEYGEIRGELEREQWENLTYGKFTAFLPVSSLVFLSDSTHSKLHAISAMNAV